MLKERLKKRLFNPDTVLWKIGLAPEQEYKGKTFVKGFVYVNLMCFAVSQILHLVLKFEGVTQLAQVGTVLLNVLQSCFKSSLLFYYTDKLKEMLVNRATKLWPVNIFGDTEERKLNKFLLYSKILVTYEFFVGGNFYVQTYLKPLRDGERKLAVPLWLPFGITSKPVFLMVYVWEFLAAIYVTMFILIGVDFIFIMYKSSCIVQFRLLKYALRRIGTEEQDEIIKAVERFRGPMNVWDGKRFSAEFRLLVYCVQHHQMLLKFCDDVETVFTSAVFIQYLISCVSICVSTFLIDMLSFADKVNIIMLVIGYLGQLLIFCSFGNEFSYQSSRIFTVAADNDWYKALDKNLANGMTMMLLRSKKTAKLTAFGFADLDYMTYIKILRLSFSFYTLLNSIAGKK